MSVGKQITTRSNLIEKELTRASVSEIHKNRSKRSVHGSMDRIDTGEGRLNHLDDKPD
jgi:hypothetical protein